MVCEQIFQCFNLKGKTSIESLIEEFQDTVLVSGDLGRETEELTRAPAF